MSKYSDWRTDLREVMDDDTDEKKVSEKKVNNAKLIKINPKLGEAVEELGGQIIEMKEVDDADDKIEKDADADKKAAMADKVKKKEAMLKKRIVRMKMMAVNQGAADSIVAGYEPEGEVIDEAERSIDDRLERKRKLYKKTTRKAMDYARREGEAAGHARYRMSSISRESDKLAAKKNVNEGVMKFIKSVGKKPEKKAQKATDAGARARRKLQQKDHEKVNFLPMDEGKGYQPEIEVIKSKDLKKKERESKLPPHLQGDALGKMKKAFASTNEEVVGEGAMKAIKNFVNPDPSLSNEPSVRAGVRTPKTGFKHVPSFSKDGTSGSYGKKGTTAVVDTAKPVVKKATQVAGNVTKGVTSAVAKGIKQGATAVGKAVLPVAGGVGAGLAVSKGVDNLMKAGKKKKVDEELSIVDKMLIEFAPTPVKEGVVDVVKKGAKRHKDAVEKKKIKNRKAVPYAALAAEHEPEGNVVTEADKKGKGSGKKDACYNKVKASAKVWPSAYASGTVSYTHLKLPTTPYV